MSLRACVWYSMRALSASKVSKIAIFCTQTTLQCAYSGPGSVSLQALLVLLVPERLLTGCWEVLVADTVECTNAWRPTRLLSASMVESLRTSFVGMQDPERAGVWGSASHGSRL